jgi:hypothetical protein
MVDFFANVYDVRLFEIISILDGVFAEASLLCNGQVIRSQHGCDITVFNQASHRASVS